MLELLGDANAVALIGLIGGIALGLAARVGRFCTLGAIEDILYSSDDRRMRMWGVAIGVAIIGSHLAMAGGFLEGSETDYLTRKWSPLSSIIGGLMFGYGMAMCGNCGYGALARLGGGDLRSFVVLMVMALSAYFVMSGPLAQLRVWLFPVEYDDSSVQGLSQLFQAQMAIPPLYTGLGIGALILLIALWDKRMRQSPKFIFWGALVGLAVVSGWVGTQWVAATGFDAESVRTHTFVAPVGDTIFYIMTASGNTLSFSVGSVVGVLIGACLGSFSKGHFRWEGGSADETG